MAGLGRRVRRFAVPGAGLSGRSVAQTVRVDLVGVALSVAAVALLTRSTGTRAVVAAGVLAGLAMLCKQTFIAALIAGTLWQWRDWPKGGCVLRLGAAHLRDPVPVARSDDQWRVSSEHGGGEREPVPSIHRRWTPADVPGNAVAAAAPGAGLPGSPAAMADQRFTAARPVLGSVESAAGAGDRQGRRERQLLDRVRGCDRDPGRARCGVGAELVQERRRSRGRSRADPGAGNDGEWSRRSEGDGPDNSFGHRNGARILDECRIRRAGRSGATRAGRCSPSQWTSSCWPVGRCCSSRSSTTCCWMLVAGNPTPWSPVSATARSVWWSSATRSRWAPG